MTTQYSIYLDNNPWIFSFTGQSNIGFLNIYLIFLNIRIFQKSAAPFFISGKPVSSKKARKTITFVSWEFQKFKQEFVQKDHAYYLLVLVIKHTEASDIISVVDSAIYHIIGGTHTKNYKTQLSSHLPISLC